MNCRVSPLVWSHLPSIFVGKHPRISIFAPLFQPAYAGARDLEVPLANYFAFCRGHWQVDASAALTLPGHGEVRLRYHCFQGIGVAGAYPMGDPIGKSFQRMLRTLNEAQIALFAPDLMPSFRTYLQGCR